MKVKLFFAIPFVMTLSGCGSEEADVSTDVVPEQTATSVAQNDADNLEKLINPAPILALSQVGNVNNTPQFIRSQKVEQAFKNGRPHRELTIHFYRNGPNRFHGPYKEWYPNGSLWKEGLYDENNRVGEWKWYAENGELAKHAIYDQQGLADGEWIYFHDNGTKRRKESFRMGKRHGQTEYYNNDGSQLLEVFSFKDDRLDGEVTRWFPLTENQTESQKQKQTTFLEGKRNGAATEWYEDGQIKSEVEFKNGDRHGRTRRWDKDGNIELDLLFEDGEAVDPSATANKESPAAEPTLDKNDESQSPDSSPNGESTPEKTNP
ncbi:MAG: toxin-antitoxin system YwqK family antitoxin [Planctomycetales bacterium]